MRQIKFRAWDDGEGLMWYSDGTPDAMGDRVDSMERFWYLVARYAPEVMQYTGLKDADGREIYEGDIVEHISGGTPSVVEWWGFSWSDNIYKPHNRVVIGNIHETPELLCG